MLPESVNSDFTKFLTGDVSQSIITKYTGPSDWENISKVSQRWQKLMPKAFVQLSSLLRTLKTIPPRMEDECNLHQTMRDIVKILAPWNLVEAESYAAQMAAEYYGPSMYKAEAFKFIVKEEAKYALDCAKARAASLEREFARDEALLHIVAKEASVDLEGAKQTDELIDYSSSIKAQAYMEIAKYDYSYFAKAIEIVGTFEVVDLVKAQARVNLEDAKKTAANIENAKFRFKALIEIAKLDPRCDVEKLRNSILENPDLKPQTKIKLLIKVATLGNDTDLTTLRKLADEIADLTDKAWSLIDIADYDPRHDFSVAKEIAKTIQFHMQRNRAFSEAAIREAAHDFEKGLETLNMVEDVDEMDSAYKKLALALARENRHEEALALVSQIDSPQSQAYAFAGVGALNPKDFLERARGLSSHFDELSDKAYFLLSVAEIFSKKAKKLS